ncbi:MAG: HNH endonuclease [Alphaproteobacteria bacterium]
MTYKVGSLHEFAEWTKRVVRDQAGAGETPKRWFDSEATARAAATERISAEAMVKLLSTGNLAVLDAIRRHKPASVRALAALTGRKEASLSRTLKRFEELGIIALQNGPHRTRIPALIAQRVHLEIELTAPLQRCIFCLQERSGNKEHVFPLAIGGRLTTDRVCGSCNAMLGSRVDAALSDNVLVRSRRAQLGLAGNSGTPPAAHEMLLGVAKLAEHPERRVQIAFNKATGKLDIKAIYHASDVVMPDGAKARQIIVDEKDKDQIPKIIQKERERHGVPPLSAEQLAAEVRRWTENVITVENPRVLIERSYSFAYVRHALIKIAYELAFLWLGESYLDDPSAAELRAAICDPDPASTDGLPAYVGDAEGCDAFKFWSPNKTHHLAYAVAWKYGISIAVRVFDVHAAVVCVTKDPARYLTGRDTEAKLRFLAIEPVSGKMHDTSFMDETLRIAAAMTAAQ